MGRRAIQADRPTQATDKALAELKAFCPLCYRIEVQRRKVDRLRREDGSDRLHEEEAKLRAMVKAHPKCRGCGLLFGHKHLARGGRQGYCQFCQRERRGKNPWPKTRSEGNDGYAG